MPVPALRLTEPDLELERDFDAVCVVDSLMMIVKISPTPRALRSAYMPQALSRHNDLASTVDAVNSVGTINLIKQGAAPVTCAWDVMSEFMPLYPDRIRHAANTAQKTVLERAAEKQQTVSTPPEKKPAPQKDVDSGERQVYIDWKEQLSQLNEDQLKIISAIEKNATHIDDIVEATGLGAAKVLAQLTVLEIKGYIRREAGRRVALKITKK